MENRAYLENVQTELCRNSLDSGHLSATADALEEDRELKAIVCSSLRQRRPYERTKLLEHGGLGILWNVLIRYAQT